jgi:tetratricopeptide (TPR) repeat protein
MAPTLDISTASSALAVVILLSHSPSTYLDDSGAEVRMLKPLLMSMLLLSGGTMALADAGSDCSQKEDHDLRIRGCTQIIRQNRDPKLMADAYTNRGLAYRYKGEYDRAIADYNKAIASKPTAQVYNHRGWAYYLKGDYDRAIADASLAISLDPKYKFSFHTRGEAFRAKGAFDRALLDFNQALALDPTHLASRASLAMTYEAMGNREKAIENFSRTQGVPVTSSDAKDYQTAAAKRLAALKSTPLALHALAPNAIAPAAGRRIALLIGNQRYTETRTRTVMLRYWTPRSRRSASRSWL